MAKLRRDKQSVVNENAEIGSTCVRPALRGVGGAFAAGSSGRPRCVALYGEIVVRDSHVPRAGNVVGGVAFEYDAGQRSRVSCLELIREPHLTTTAVLTLSHRSPYHSL